MSQYVPYIPEVIPETPLFRADFNFFDRMIQRKQAMFEQGLGRARSAYSSVLTAPLANKNNIPLRDQYVKDAKESLKTLASADLSLPQNVTAAENIFAPFWQDNFIMKDLELTRSYQNAFQTMESMKNSPDPKVREQYSGIAERYLINGFERLQNADRTEQAFSTLEKRKAVPFVNIEQFLQEQAKAQGLEIKVGEPDGPYLVETLNGKRSQQKYSTWAKSLVGNNFYEQFRVTGVVEREERTKGIKRLNPNLSDQEVDAAIANDVVKELKDGYNRRLSEVDVEIARVDSLISSIASGNNPSNQQLFNSLLEERARLIADKTGINQEYTNFDKESKDIILNSVLGNPVGYFATLAKQRVIDNWATGRASIESKLVKENTAWTAAENINLRRKEYELNQQKAVWDRDQQLWERANPTGKGSKSPTGLKDKDGNPIESPSEEAAEQSLAYRGPSGIDITKDPGTAYDRFVIRQQQNFAEAHSLIFDQRGILGLAKNLGLDQTEISHVAAALQKEMTDFNYSFTKEQKQATKKLEAALLANQGVKDAGITKLTGPSTLRNALIAYAQDYFNQRNQLSKEGNDVALSKDESESLLRYITAVEKLNNYTANEERRKQLLNTNILTNKKFAPLVVERGGGNKDLITASDLAKDMPSLTLLNKATGEIVNYSKDEVAKLFMNGKLTQTFNAELSIDGNNYYINKVNQDEGTFMSNPPEKIWNNIYNKQLVPKYGKSSDFSKLVKEANESIVPDLLVYKSQSGKQGISWTLTPLEKKTGSQDLAWSVVNEALNTNNGDIVIHDDGTNRVTPIDPTKTKAIRTLLSKESNVEKFTSIEYIPQGVGGKRTVRLHFSQPISAEDKQVVAASGLKEIFDLGTIDVVLRDDVQTPAINQLPNNTGYQVFDVLSRGRVIKSDPVVAASGFNFTITPNVVTSEGSADERPSYVTVDLEYNERVNEKDPATGQLVTNIKPRVKSSRIDLVGPNAKSPDEIVNYLYGLYLESMQSNQARLQEYQTYTKTNPEVKQQFVDFSEQLRKLGLEKLIRN